MLPKGKWFYQREDSLSVPAPTSPKHKRAGLFCQGFVVSLAWNKKSGETQRIKRSSNV